MGNIFGTHYEHHCELCNTTDPEIYGYTSRQVPPGWGFLHGKKACHACMIGQHGNNRGRVGTMKKSATPFAVLTYLYGNAYLKRCEFMTASNMSKASISQALQELTRRGHVSKVSRGIYRITKQGRDFMEREVV